MISKLDWHFHTCEPLVFIDFVDKYEDYHDDTAMVNQRRKKSGGTVSRCVESIESSFVMDSMINQVRSSLSSLDEDQATSLVSCYSQPTSGLASDIQMDKTAFPIVSHENDAPQDPLSNQALSNSQRNESKSAKPTKKTKSRSKVHVITSEHEADSGDDTSDNEAQYDLQICIDESGGIDRFLETPCMVLYRRNLSNQGQSDRFYAWSCICCYPCSELDDCTRHFRFLSFVHSIC